MKRHHSYISHTVHYPELHTCLYAGCKHRTVNDPYRPLILLPWFKEEMVRRVANRSIERKALGSWLLESSIGKTLSWNEVSRHFLPIAFWLPQEKTVKITSEEFVLFIFSTSTMWTPQHFPNSMLARFASPWPMCRKSFIVFSANSLELLKLSSKVTSLGSSPDTPSSPL